MIDSPLAVLAVSNERRRAHPRVQALPVKVVAAKDAKRAERRFGVVQHVGIWILREDPLFTDLTRFARDVDHELLHHEMHHSAQGRLRHLGHFRPALLREFELLHLLLVFLVRRVLFLLDSGEQAPRPSPLICAIHESPVPALSGPLHRAKICHLLEKLDVVLERPHVVVGQPYRWSPIRSAVLRRRPSNRIARLQGVLNVLSCYAFTDGISSLGRVHHHHSLRKGVVEDCKARSLIRVGLGDLNAKR
mmetsp:Transcript_11733/g.43730  ORF Transcript_11733/g.43730 Transcript_11733/m.43730 type:complete len:248 (+) Transcript_11733:312-1055(+)